MSTYVGYPAAGAPALQAARDFRYLYVREPAASTAAGVTAAPLVPVLIINNHKIVYSATGD